LLQECTSFLSSFYQKKSSEGLTKKFRERGLCLVIQAYQRGLHVLRDDDDDDDNDESLSRRNARKKAADASAVSEVERQKPDSTIGSTIGLLYSAVFDVPNRFG